MSFKIIFLVSLGLLVYSYLVYPMVLIIIDSFKKKREFSGTGYEPTVSVIMAVYNEEIVLEEKLKVLIEADYPVGKYEIIIGSDNSTDSTNSIIEEFERSHKNITGKIFSARRGKPAVINNLASIATGDILIITDADVMIQKDSIRSIVSVFSDPATGLAESIITGSLIKSRGISLQERTYLNLESRIKQAEGRVSGDMMGPSGGFYAIRRELYSHVPEYFLVDDLFISLNVILKGYRALVAENAFAYENINDDLAVEFRRKVRISTGNFQILAHFSSIILKPWKRPFISFFSHKVIRWIGPLIYILLLTSNCFLIQESFFFSLLFLLQLIFLLLPLPDIILKKFSINLVPLRFITHFILMNIALMAGLWHFIRGIDSGIWEPTKRTKRINRDEQV